VIDHYDKKAAWNICLLMKNNGLLAKPTHGDKIRLAPPLIITEEQVVEAVNIIKQSIDAFGK
jgi:ornithine--oxo-acid transaminase